MAAKKIVNLQMWRRNRTSLEMTGRFLGLISSRELAIAIKFPAFRKRMATTLTMDLSTIESIPQADLKDKRMVFVAKEIDGETKNDPTLLVSDRIDYISERSHKDMTIQCANDMYIILQEADKDS